MLERRVIFSPMRTPDLCIVNREGLERLWVDASFALEAQLEACKYHSPLYPYWRSFMIFGVPGSAGFREVY